MPAIRKIIVSPINISTSANISPAPCVDLSANDVNAPNADITAIIEKSTPDIVSKVEIVFFIPYKIRKPKIYLQPALYLF
jgi:hypothetical protein